MKLYYPLAKLPKLPMSHPLFKAIPLLVILLGISDSAYAQSNWISESGEWLDGANWSSGNPPGSSVVARFAATETAPWTEVNLTIGSGSAKAATASALQVWSGMTVNITMADGASLIADSPLWRIGYSNPAIPNAAAALTFTGPSRGSATVQLGQLQVGASGGSDPETAPAGGHRLTFSGPGLVVSEGGAVASVIGRFGSDNRLEILNGADVTRYSVDISAPQTEATAGKRDNAVVVEGQGSFLTVQNTLTVGAGAGTRSNMASVGNSSAVVTADRATLRVKTLDIGRNTSNLGGNLMLVGKGGTLESTGATAVRGYAVNGGDNDGRNRLVIDEGGWFSSGGDITNDGLVVLQSGGVLEGRDPLTGNAADITLTVNPDGRFEVAGNGLAANVTTQIQNGRMAIGVTPESGSRSSGELLTLQSAVQFHATAGGALEMTWFASGDFDQIDFLSTGIFSGGEIRLELNLGGNAPPVAGTEWTLFTGETAGITANFDLSLIDDMIWDTSNFNAEGGWRVVAIPEPGSIALAAFGVLAVTWRRFRRSR